MKQIINPTVKPGSTHIKTTLAVFSMLLFSVAAMAQNCATSGTDNIGASENTYYPGTQASVSAGATSIQLGAAGSGTNFGTTPIASGDIVLIIQMQGAQINVPASSTNSLYGGNTSGSGSGFITTNLLAGNMEFAVATNAVPIGGGTLNIAAGLTYAYANTAYGGTTGQYTYQIIRVPHHYNIMLTAAITTPQWNGSVGGVTVISAVNQLNFNGMTIDADGAGFRGGGGRKLSGASGTNQTDYYTLSSTKANGSKGEGIAGTPRYLNFNNALVNTGVEGYPSGSYARGAPGNAGGGGTDSDPTSNDQNSGGGGGGNGGSGGVGGNGWYSFGYTGGRPGYKFATTGPNVSYFSPSRLIMGGGGGSGSTNDGTGDYSNGFSSSGAPGGGIVIINALTISGSGTVNASGDSVEYHVKIDGSGGGGAGGSILIYANSGQSGITAIANGGDGASNYPSGSGATQHGPGGGGGGGVIFSNGTLNAASSSNKGLAGYSYGSGTITDIHFGAGDGINGVLTQTFPFAQLPPNMQICQISVLPVTILDFNATYVSSNNVKVSWSTTNEINASYFEVERSTNATDFISVARVDASQESNPVNYYTANDQLVNVNAGIIYYRLRIVDQSGKFVYSKVVPVKLDQPQTSISVYPNPVDNYTILNLYSDKQSVGELRVMDNSGRQILTKNVTVNNGNNSIMIDQLGNLPKGLYVAQVLLNNNLYNIKLLKK
ncbi:MAG: T9SS type A sorting domain-containing protein [Bacteroidota bacterium]|nr:T9SS type A sorting domain-containing protein [Bacteroidota bacterium]